MPPTRVFLAAQPNGAFILSGHMWQLIAAHAPRACAVRAYLAPDGRTAWLQPVAHTEEGDIPIRRYKPTPHRCPRSIRTVLQSAALRYALSAPSGRIPATWDGDAFRLTVSPPQDVRLPRRPATLTLRVPA
jgi:hypothetical protein